MKHCTIPENWSGDEALAFVALLERLTRSIWRAHGDEMARCLALRNARRDPHSHWTGPSAPTRLRYEPIPFPGRQR